MATLGAVMKNPVLQTQPRVERDYFFTTKNGCRLFVYEYCPIQNYKASLFIISGITGINHRTEKELVLLLSNGRNRVVIIHPRGTGYSEGKRGDIVPFGNFITDYVEIITAGTTHQATGHQLFLFGHSMAAAVLMAVARRLPHVSGAILVNPPYKRKKAAGMSPGPAAFFKYAWYALFKPHQPVVDMAGDPALIKNEADRQEAERRVNDPLLVSHFSMYMMMATNKLLRAMFPYAGTAHYPLLLLYGTNDSIADERGCDRIYENWKFPDKRYVLVNNGTHGSSTVTLAKRIITQWLDKKINSST